jgi:hypothetical protein
LYKKSIKENDKFSFGNLQLLTTIAENVITFTLLFKDGRLNLNKLEKVFREESLDGVETNVIDVNNFSINFVKSLYYWNMERFF